MEACRPHLAPNVYFSNLVSSFRFLDVSIAHMFYFLKRVLGDRSGLKSFLKGIRFILNVDPCRPMVIRSMTKITVLRCSGGCQHTFSEAIMDHGSWILDLGSWILDLGSWILNLTSWIMEPGSWILDLGSWILDLGSWIMDPGSWILDLGSWIVDRGS